MHLIFELLEGTDLNNAIDTAKAAYDRLNHQISTSTASGHTSRDVLQAGSGIAGQSCDRDRDLVGGETRPIEITAEIVG